MYNSKQSTICYIILYMLLDTIVRLLKKIHFFCHTSVHRYYFKYRLWINNQYVYFLWKNILDHIADSELIIHPILFIFRRVTIYINQQTFREHSGNIDSKNLV